MTVRIVVHLVLMALLVLLGWLLPTFSNRTVPFGVRVPDERADDPAVVRATTRYRWRVLVGGGVVAAGGIALVATVAASVAVIAPLLVILAVWYANFLVAHREVRRAKADQRWYAGVRQGATADTALHSDPPRFPWAWAAPSVLVVAVTALAGALRYPHLPDPLPVHYSGSAPDRFAAKSVATVFTPVFVQVGLTALLLVLTALSFRARADLDPARPAGSAALHRDRVVRLARAVLALAALLDLGLLGGAWLDWSDSRQGWLAALVTALPPLVGVVALLVVARRVNRAQPPAEGTGLEHRDDDQHWRGGLFYVNPDDPSWFVPRRFGVGWTINIGNRVALLVCATCTVAVVALAIATRTTLH